MRALGQTGHWRGIRLHGYVEYHGSEICTAIQRTGYVTERAGLY